ncbi:MAG: hypothetical protein HZA90_02705 [Verrucomicrobia bacterium]|nr:hypothetical protein [Verrucomicrobiota bacterium]
MRRTNELAGLDRRNSTPLPARGLAQKQRLRERVPGVKVERHAITGSPQWVGAPDQFLTGPDRQGGAVTPVFRAKHRDDDPHRAIRPAGPGRRQDADVQFRDHDFDPQLGKGTVG